MNGRQMKANTDQDRGAGRTDLFGGADCRVKPSACKAQGRPSFY